MTAVQPFVFQDRVEELPWFIEVGLAERFDEIVQLFC
jgi:hypothetical protein